VEHLTDELARLWCLICTDVQLETVSGEEVGMLHTTVSKEEDPGSQVLQRYRKYIILGIVDLVEMGLTLMNPVRGA
jgi:hypothetical protein